MGKPTGFMEYAREVAPYRGASLRVLDWKEFHEHLPEERLRQQGARCMDCGVPFCHSDHTGGCPVNNLTLELALADADYRSELNRLFALWRSTIEEKLAARSDSEDLAALVVAAYSGAMALAKVEQRGEPLRLCASEIEHLL